MFHGWLMAVPNNITKKKSKKMAFNQLKSYLVNDGTLLHQRGYEIYISFYFTVFYVDLLIFYTGFPLLKKSIIMHYRIISICLLAYIALFLKSTLDYHFV